MTHAEMDELYDLYALGVLEPELAAEIESHLSDHCTYCLQHVQDAFSLVAALANVTEPVRPPSRLRERVLAGVSPSKRPSSRTFAFAVLSTACAALLLFSVWSANEMSRLRNQRSELERERNELRSAVELLSKPDTRTVQFGRENVPHGRVLVNRTGGLVFVGSQLPALAGDKTLELWVIPTTGTPRPAGLFRPNAAGDSVSVSSLVVSADAKAVAVTVEPRAGSRTPTTTPFLVVPLV